MKALILAAGMGKRISHYSNDKPKCLLDINGKSILEHQLNKLEKVGIKKKDIIIVTGYKAEYIKKIAGNEIKYIHNFDYASTNSLYSMWLARKENFNDGMLLLNADIIFHKDILVKLVERKDNTLAVDFNKKLIDGEMNVIVKNEKIIQIDKGIKANNANGESVQIVKFNHKSVKILYKECDNLIKQGIRDKFPAYVYMHIIKKQSLFAVDIESLPWIEIDYPEDYEKAKQINWD